MLYRVLDESEAKAFRAWAREHYYLGAWIDEAWHPTVRAECDAMNLEAGRTAAKFSPAQCGRQSDRLSELVGAVVALYHEHKGRPPTAARLSDAVEACVSKLRVGVDPLNVQEIAQQSV